MSDFDFEPVPGLPGHLPDGETLLWQGAPDWWCLARRVFHLPLIAGYLGMFAIWRIVSAIYDQQPLLDAARGLSVMALLIVACCAILAAIAYATARTTVYSVTSERVIMRYGIALPMALNIPFAKVEGAAAKLYAGGCGDIPLTLAAGEKIAYVMLWPHARPWRVKRPEPMLRGIPQAAAISALLAQALAAAASRPAQRGKVAASAVPAMPPAVAHIRRPTTPDAATAEPLARLA